MKAKFHEAPQAPMLERSGKCNLAKKALSLSGHISREMPCCLTTQVRIPKFVGSQRMPTSPKKLGRERLDLLLVLWKFDLCSQPSFLCFHVCLVGWVYVYCSIIYLSYAALFFILQGFIFALSHKREFELWNFQHGWNAKIGGLFKSD